MHHISVGEIEIGNDLPFVLFAGPCVIEGESFTLEVAEALRDIAARCGVPFVFKSSFDKANRTSVDAFRGPGMEEGLRILKRVKDELGLPVITDVHTPEQVEAVAAVADILQTPAFLCRQTDFIQAVAKAGKPVNIKKGQFLAPWDMPHVLEKARATGNDDIMLCDRGTSFGYNNLVSDFRSLMVMALGGATGGNREFVPGLSRAAVAIGVAALFMEVHPSPDEALSDGPNSLRLDELEELLNQLSQLDRVAKSL
jgi:2-dehydro-3-deoxyphosphooctonate aldolase (KDO 8-P synthase)